MAERKGERTGNTWEKTKRGRWEKKKKTDAILRGKRHVERRMRQRHARSERKGKICSVLRGKRPGTSERNGDLELTMWHANNVK